MPDIKRTAPNTAFDAPSEPLMAVPPAKKGGSWGKKIAIIIIIIVLILVGLFLVSKYTKLNILNVNKSAASASGWHAVSLSNGQVYFGEITKRNSEQIVLSNIYYLQVTGQIQPADQNAQQDQSQNLSLVKLGNELHGPRDAMKINMAHVLFTEELKSDSRVVDAIVRYLEENK